MDDAKGLEELDCDSVAVRLWDFVDGELPSREMAQVDAHLEDCERCFPVYRFRKAFQEFLRCQEKSEVPVGLRRAVFERILEEHREMDQDESPSLWERLRDATRRDRD